jgi:hypothetical protein
MQFRTPIPGNSLRIDLEQQHSSPVEQGLVTREEKITFREREQQQETLFGLCWLAWYVMRTIRTFSWIRGFWSVVEVQRRADGEKAALLLQNIGEQDLMKVAESDLLAQTSSNTPVPFNRVDLLVHSCIRSSLQTFSSHWCDMNKDKNTRDLMVNFQNRTPHP